MVIVSFPHVLMVCDEYMKIKISQAILTYLTQKFQAAVLEYQEQVATLSDKEKADFERSLAHKQVQLENCKKLLVKQLRYKIGK